MANGELRRNYVAFVQLRCPEIDKVLSVNHGNRKIVRPPPPLGLFDFTAKKIHNLLPDANAKPIDLIHIGKKLCS